MPSYDYKCKDCGTIEERTHSMNDDAIQTCKLCFGVMKKCYDNISKTEGFIINGAFKASNNYGGMQK